MIWDDTICSMNEWDVWLCAYLPTILLTSTGLYTVLGKSDAVRALDLPQDLIGDLVVLGDQSTVVGKTPKDHDISHLKGQRLRSHGGAEIFGWKEGWVNGWMNGWMDGWINGWIDGWINGWMVYLCVLYK